MRNEERKVRSKQLVIEEFSDQNIYCLTNSDQKTQQKRQKISFKTKNKKDLTLFHKKEKAVIYSRKAWLGESSEQNKPE